MSKISITTSQHGPPGACLAGSMRRVQRSIHLSIEVAYPVRDDQRHSAIPDSRMVRMKRVPDTSVPGMKDSWRHVPDESHDCAEDPAVRPGVRIVSVQMTPEQFGELLCMNGSVTDCTIDSLWSGGHLYEEEVEDPGTVSSRLKARLVRANADARARVVNLVNHVSALKGLSDNKKAEIKDLASLILRDMGGSVAYAAEMAAEEVSRIAEGAVHLIESKAENLASLRNALGPGGAIEAPAPPGPGEDS